MLFISAVVNMVFEPFCDRPQPERRPWASQLKPSTLGLSCPDTPRLFACTCQASFGVALCDQSREADDIVDEGGTDAQKSSRAAPAPARARRGVRGAHPTELMMSALATTVERYKLDKKHLADVIDGCEMDLLKAEVEGRPNRLA